MAKSWALVAVTCLGVALVVLLTAPLVRDNLVPNGDGTVGDRRLLPTVTQTPLRSALAAGTVPLSTAATLAAATLPTALPVVPTALPVVPTPTAVPVVLAPGEVAGFPSTTLAAAALPNALMISVVSTLNMAVGYSILIGVLEEKTITSIAGSEITFASPLADAHALGESVAVVSFSATTATQVVGSPGCEPTTCTTLCCDATYCTLPCDDTLDLGPLTEIQNTIWAYEHGGCLFGWVMALIFTCLYRYRIVQKIEMKDIYHHTTVDNFDPMSPAQHKWDSIGLFGCLREFNTCCLVIACPYAVAAKNYHVTHSMSFWPACCCVFFTYQVPPLGALVRTYLGTEMKNEARIQSSCCMDFLLNCFCAPCEIGRESMFIDSQVGVQEHICGLTVQDTHNGLMMDQPPNQQNFSYAPGGHA